MVFAENKATVHTFRHFRQIARLGLNSQPIHLTHCKIGITYCTIPSFTRRTKLIRCKIGITYWMFLKIAKAFRFGLSNLRHDFTRMMSTQDDKMEIHQNMQLPILSDKAKPSELRYTCYLSLNIWMLATNWACKVQISTSCSGIFTWNR